MYVIVEIAGFQYKIEKDQKLLVHRLEGEEGSSVTFNKVLLTQDGDTVQVGTPVIDGVSVEARILEHQKGDKVIVFKKKRRKGYQKQNGHRQYLTKIEIVSIGGESNATAPKVEVKKVIKAEKTSSNDDLKIIEGIGPKAAEALVNAGVDTFKKLSEKNAEEIKQILTEASSKLAILEISTWAEQSKLADEGKFDELKTWQDQLKGGKIV